jgi:hypothetical protein|nr:MAG TPA: hypothetical protein [Caudoviricetes sp.]
MRQRCTDYLNELSGDRFDILEDLIINKYRHFRKFYKFISCYTDDISHILYQFNSKESLDIVIEIKPDVDNNKFIDTIIDSNSDYNIFVKACDEGIKMSINV